MNLEELENEIKGLGKLVNLLMKDLERMKDDNHAVAHDVDEMHKNMEGHFHQHGNEVDSCKKKMDEKVQKAVEDFNSLENKMLDIIHGKSIRMDQHMFAFQSVLLRLCKFIYSWELPDDKKRELVDIIDQVNHLEI